MPLTYEDCCAALELEGNPDQKKIRKAYKRLVLKYHPDKLRLQEQKPTDEQLQAAQAKFIQIHDGFAALEKAGFVKTGFISSHRREAPIRKSMREIEKEIRDEAIQDMLDVVKANESPEAEKLGAAIQKLQKITHKWHIYTQALYSDSYSIDIDHIKIAFMGKMERYFICLKNCLQLNDKNQLELNNPWNKALLQTFELLLKVVEHIDPLAEGTNFGQVHFLFEPIINILEEAQNQVSVQESLTTLNKDAETQAVYKTGLTLATTLVQRAIQNFSFRYAFFVEGSTGMTTGGEKGDNNPYLAQEMKTLNSFLRQTVTAKTSPQAAERLDRSIQVYQKSAPWTLSLYWKKFIASIATWLSKRLGTYNTCLPKGTYFDEKICKNRFFSSLKTARTSMKETPLSAKQHRSPLKKPPG